MSSKAIKRLEESYKLPLGHVERRLAEAAVRQIYAKCHSISAYWMKRFGKAKHKSLAPDEALSFCNALCKSVGSKPIREVVVCSSEVDRGCAGHYDWRSKKIHCMYEANLSLVVHELAHHVAEAAGCGHGHGKDFCFILNWLFQEAYKIRCKKTVKPYWLVEADNLLAA